MLALVARWFEPVAVSQDYRRTHFVVLALMLAVGAALRFWALGNAGVHGDEDLMGLAARGVLEHGIPVMPPGWIYTRVPLHTYIMAGSMFVFGDTEWAMRFPSAVIGSFCGLFAFFMGKRFLEPNFNLAFAALITFLPAMIEISQTARMYIFFVAALLIFGTLLFRWERRGTPGALVLAMLGWMVALHLHSLAVFAAPLFLFPGLSKQSWRQLVHGGMALIMAVVFFRVHARLTSSGYPSEYDTLPPPPDASLTPLEHLAQGPWLVVALIAVAAIAVLLFFGLRHRIRQPRVVLAVGLLGLGVAACAALHYHIGGILLLVGAIAWLRAQPGRYLSLVLLALGVGLMLAIQLAVLHGTGEFTGQQYIGALVGMPSVWPILRFGTVSPVGMVVMAAIVAFAAWQLAHGRRIPVHFLFFAMAVWAPLFGLGLFTWDLPPRYTFGVLPFFALCLLAGIAYVVDQVRVGRAIDSRPVAQGLTCVLLVIVFVNPVSMVVAASNDYRSHPDHKGVAKFIKSLNPGPDDILIAEDSVAQTFYLGKVDYRLLNWEVARTQSILVDGVLRGRYTGTPIMGTGEELLALLDRTDIKGEIYIIGSGTTTPGSRRRGNGIEEVLESDKLELIYTGRDGIAHVWRRRSP
jgi:hypothetical protein